MGLIQNLQIAVIVALSHPQLRLIVIAVFFIAIAAAASRRFWVQCLIAIVLFALSTAASVWVLQLGWALAALGILLLVSGLIWKLVDRSSSAEAQPVRTHASGGFIWPGVGLLAAPFANVFALMPALRPFFT